MPKYVFSAASTSAGCPAAASSQNPAGASAIPSGHVSSPSHNPCAVARPHSRFCPAPWCCATNVPEYPASAWKKIVIVSARIPAGNAARSDTDPWCARKIRSQNCIIVYDTIVTMPGADTRPISR